MCNYLMALLSLKHNIKKSSIENLCRLHVLREHQVLRAFIQNYFSFFFNLYHKLTFIVICTSKSILTYFVVNDSSSYNIIFPMK